jgi:predicted secreted protein
VLTDSDTGSHVLLNSGDRFEIRLESNATTGYEWVVTEAGLPDIVELVGDRYEAPDTDLVGAPGTQVFVVEAIRQGADVLRLEYVRPFEDPMIPERVVEFIIRIDGAVWPPVDGGTSPGTPSASVADTQP